MSSRAIETPSAVIVISSHVARGSVGNRAAVFALETLGHPVWAVPTVILPWHTGHGPATRIVPSAEQFSALMADLQRAPWLGEVTAVLSGYLGDAAPGRRCRGAGPAGQGADARRALCLRPGDGRQAGLYVPIATAEAMRDILLPIADIATPNRYELDWIAGRKLHDMSEIVQAARELAPRRMLVTSAPAMTGGYIGNLLAHRRRRALCGTPADLRSAERHGRPDRVRVSCTAAGRP